MKKILWVLAGLPDHLARKYAISGQSCGNWINEMLQEAGEQNQYEIAVACCGQVRSLVKHKLNNIQYYVIPLKNATYKSVDQSFCDQVINDYDPDMVHLWGSELSIQEQFSRYDCKIAVHIQGLMTSCLPYELGALEMPLFENNESGFYIDKIMLKAKKRFVTSRRLSFESKVLANANVFMGRTLWDEAQLHWINPSARYYTVNEVLRPSFFSSKWELERCKRHTVFIGNGYKPLKGLHFALQAAGYLLNEFPDIRLVVAGSSPFSNRIGHYGYSRIVHDLIKKNGLSENVTFLGYLDEKELVKRMLSCHVYLIPSLIENSSNSLGEAQALGIPCVASDVGGTSSFVKNECTGLLYRAEDAKLLAYQIARLFSDDDLCLRLSFSSRKEACRIHDPKRCWNEMLNVYVAEVGV